MAPERKLKKSSCRSSQRETGAPVEMLSSFSIKTKSNYPEDSRLLIKLAVSIFVGALAVILSVGESIAQIVTETSLSNSGPTSQDEISARHDQLQEVVVTAEYHKERVLDTPVSMSVVSATDLSKLGAVTFTDWATSVPGLSFKTAGAGYTTITLRGITTGSDLSATVATYIDDVPLGSATENAGGAFLGFDDSLFDIQRIEVLRGPQGTLYGATSLGGLIKYVTKLPDTSSFATEIQSGVSDTEDGGLNYTGGIAVNAPILEHKAAMRASAFYSHDDGYIDNVARNDKEVNRFSKYGGRLDLLFKPTDALTVRIGGFIQDIGRNGTGDVAYAQTGMPVYGRLGQYYPYGQPFHQQFRLGSATVTYNFGEATLTSISSYQTMDSQITYDITASFVPTLDKLTGQKYGAAGEYTRITTNKATQEVRLVSNGAKRLEWVLGAFYTHEVSHFVGSFPTLNSVFQPVPNDFFFEHTSAPYRESAGYGDLTYHLTKKLDMTAGVRYSNDYSSYSASGSGLFVGAPTPPNPTTIHVFTYLADSRYHFSNYAMGYIRYATGYRPGGGNLNLVNPQTGQALFPPAYKSDNLRSYEIGYKVDMLDHRLGINVDTYYIDWSGIQLRYVTLLGETYVANASGGATSQGVELTLDAQPTDRFTMSWAFDYQDAYLRTREPALGALAVAGARLPGVPRFTAAVNGDYEVQELSLRPTFGATVRYRDAVASPFTGLRTPVPAYTTVDLRVGVTLQSVAVQLYCHNLFNRLGAVNGARLGATLESLVITQPRTVGITATARF